MFTKVKEDGKLKLIKSLKFNLGLRTGRKPARGSAMKTMTDGRKRRAYFIDKL